MKKILSVVLCLSFIFSLVASIGISVAAEGETSGSCGDNLLWNLDTVTGELEITGSGAMTSAPWSEYNEDVLSISFSTGITSIASNAFEDFTSITNVVLPDGITTIGASAFEGCTSLGSIELPSGNITIGNDAFTGCTSLSSIIKDDVDDYHFTVTGTYNNFRYRLTYGSSGYINGTDQMCASILGYSGSDTSITVPSTIHGCPVTTIVNLSTSIVETVVLPDYLYYIEDSAFRYSNHLTTVYYPNSAFYIGRWAFANCPCLEHTIAAPNTMIIFIGDYAFQASGPNYRPTYNDYAAGFAYQLETIDSVQYATIVYMLYYMAFESDIVIPSTLGGYPVRKLDDRIFYGDNDLITCEIPDCVREIGDEVFANCENLEYVKLPSGSLTLGDNVFSECYSLEEIEKTDSDINPIIINGQWWGLNYSIYNNSDFDLCAHITGYNELFDYSYAEFPETLHGFNISSIGGFEGCEYIEELILPDTIESIDDEAFMGCQYLESVQYPNSTFEIGDYAFANCPSLTETVAGANTSISSIGVNAFYNSGVNFTDLSNASASLAYTRVAYSGNANTPAVTVELNNTTLHAGTDYVLYYYNNVNIGTAGVKIVGVGTYVGSIDLSFSILSADFLPGDVDGNGVINALDIHWIKQLFVGSTNSQIVTYNADVNGDGLYTLEDLAMLKPMVTACGGEVDISDATVSLEYTRVAYSGDELEPEVSIIVDGVDVSSEFGVSYSNNINVGTATVTITGGYYFTGTANLSFEILPADFLPGDIYLDGSINYFDADMLTFYLNGQISPAVFNSITRSYNADVNGDGLINWDDLTALNALMA